VARKWKDFRSPAATNEIHPGSILAFAMQGMSDLRLPLPWECRASAQQSTSVPSTENAPQIGVLQCKSCP
jgi:hypothetical protein